MLQTYKSQYQFILIIIKGQLGKIYIFFRGVVEGFHVTTISQLTETCCWDHIQVKTHIRPLAELALVFKYAFL